MSSPLGKIDKPEADQYQEGRKIFLVPLFLSPPEAPDDLKALLEEYWEGAGEHVARLEASLGPVSHIFHETVFLEGEEGAAMLEQINPLAYRALRARYYSGAVLEATEDMELVQETTDWQRCLVSGLTSEKVFTIVVESYNDAVTRRYQHISEKINESIGEGESAILVIGEQHGVQFPSDVQVFYVSPPALDRIKQWIRDASSRTTGEVYSQPDEDGGDPRAEAEPQP